MEEELKRCNHCGKFKLLIEYYGKKKLQNNCKLCHNESTRRSHKKHAKRIKAYFEMTQMFPNLIYARKKANAKQENISFTISKEDFFQWYANQTLICHYCGLSQDDFSRTGDGFIIHKKNISVDRVDNSKGYDLSNIVLSCNRCNSIKGDFFSYEEMKIIGTKFVRKHWKEKGIKTHRQGFKGESE